MTQQVARNVTVAQHVENHQKSLLNEVAKKHWRREQQNDWEEHDYKMMDFIIPQEACFLCEC